MKIFDHPNMTNFRCPICGESKDEPVVLVKIAGTEQDGIMEAIQVHVDCLDLTMFQQHDEEFCIAQVFTKK